MKSSRIGLAVVILFIMMYSLSFADNLGILWPYEVDGHTIALWHFNEGSGNIAYDATDNHNDGTITGASWTESGRFNRALMYDGIDDYVRVPNNPSLSPFSQLSLEAWIYLYHYPDTLEGSAVIVMKERQYALIVNFDGRPYITVCNDGPWIWQLAMALEPIPCSTWVHVAGTFDQATKEIKFYVNGWLQESVVYSSWSSWDTSHDLFIGCNRDIYNEDYFPGIIDEVRISDVVRNYVVYSEAGIGESRVFLDSARLNGALLTLSNPIIITTPGERLVGNVWLHTYNEIAPTSVAPFAGTVSWGDHASSYWCIDSWIPTGQAYYKDSIDVSVPNELGQYHVGYAFQGEYWCSSVMSCTNKDVAWNDGNDVADWSSSVIDSAISYGRVIVSYLFYGQYYVPTIVPATAIKIQVATDSLIIVADTTCLSASQMKTTLRVRNNDTLSAMTIPLRYQTDCLGLRVDSVSFRDTRIEDWESKIVSIRQDTVVLGLFANVGGGTPPLPPGEGPIAYIYFSIPCNPANVYDTCFIAFDTTTVQPESQHLLFVDNHANEFVPYFQPGTTFVALYRPGDVTCNCILNPADVVYLINYLFIGGPEPCPLDAGDANGDCDVNVADVVYLINYLFAGGPPPVCRCASNPWLAGCCGGSLSLQKTAGPAQVGLVTSGSSKEGNKLLEVDASFGVEVAGVQLEFSYDPKEIQSIIPELTHRTKDMKLFFSAKNGMLKIGIIDLMGENLIPAGQGALVRLSLTGAGISSLEFKKAVLVDKNATPFELTILPKDQEQTTAPKDFILSQNFPNPFNPETEISYAIPYNTQVKLTIYNVKGQKVKTLVDGFESTGHKTIRWDGTDEAGQKVASGIYFYRLEAGDFTQTRKMVMMK